MIDTTFTGILGIEDMARHVPHHVTVPVGARTVRVAFRYDPPHPGTGPLPHQLSLSVYGPAGARGTRHNNADQSPVISETWASPGYTPGPIDPGDWVVEIDTHRILPPGQVSYTLRVWTEETPTEGPAAAPPVQVAPRGPGWYRGDLHGHSHHSDGTWPVAAFIAHARDRGLDFVTLTDHNTVSGLPEARALAGDDLLVMGGVELTTFNGHCLALGTDRWIDWRIKDGQTMSGRATEIMSAGQTYVIAHPMAPGHPWCTGCHWAYADVFPGPARLVEIWNSAWDGHKNELGLTLFQTWLNKGLRMRATAGTDSHGPIAPQVRVGYNRVWADDLTEAAILAGLRAGRTVLTAGPVLDLRVEAGGHGTGLGQEAAGCNGAVAALAWSAAPDGARLTLTAGGPDGTRMLQTGDIAGDGAERLALPDMPARGWVMATMRCAGGDMLAVTNPVFFPGDWR